MKITLNKSQWEQIGKTAGWTKTAQAPAQIQPPKPNQNGMNKIQEYVNKIRSGEDKNTVLQGLPAGWVEKVNAGLNTPNPAPNTEQQNTSTVPTQLLSPSGSPIKLYFTTAQGSQYIMAESGETRRIKSSHANTGGEDAGLHAWNQKAFFTSKEYEYLGNSPQFFIGNGYKNYTMSLKGDTVTFFVVDPKNNQWRQGTFGDAYPKSVKGDPSKANIPLSFPIVTTPKTGFFILEFRMKGNMISNYHFGSPVADVKDIKSVSPDVLKGFF